MHTGDYEVAEGNEACPAPIEAPDNIEPKSEDGSKSESHSNPSRGKKKKKTRSTRRIANDILGCGEGDQTSLLLAHTNIMILADFLQMPDLYGLASSKIEAAFENHWSKTSFLSVAEALPAAVLNQGFHQALAKKAACHVEDLAHEESFGNLDLSPFALQTIQECATRFGKENEELIALGRLVQGTLCSGCNAKTISKLRCHLEDNPSDLMSRFLVALSTFGWGGKTIGTWSQFGA